MGVVALGWVSVTGCDALLGVNLCNKTCSAGSDCGEGYSCTSGVCTSERCGNVPLASASSSGGAASVPGSSGGAVSVGSSSSSGVVVSSSSAVAASSSSGAVVASSTDIPSSAPSASSGSPTSNLAPASSGSVGTASSAAASSASSAAIASSTVVVASSSAGTGPSSVMAGFCFINGSTVVAGVDPSNICRRCDPAQSDTRWTFEPATKPCSDGDLFCTENDTCDGLGSCEGTPRCSGTTPVCSGPLACGCTLQGTDSCAAGTTNRRCRAEGGTCGCMDNGDCAAGNRCSNGQCAPCDISSACGTECLPCANLVNPDAGMMSLYDFQYFTCSGNTQSYADACTVTACGNGTRDCSDADTPDLCETSIITNRMNCGGCGVACSGNNTCSGAQCRCSQNPNTCPLGQHCRSNRCECDDDTECAPGYTCDLGENVCRR